MTGKGSVNHNSRKFHAKNTDPQRSHWNVEYCNQDIREVYHELFDGALERYNSLGKYQIQSRQKEQFYTKDKTALNVILSNCTRPRTVSWETYGDCIFPEGRESSHFL